MLDKKLIDFSIKRGSLFYYKGNFKNRPSVRILNLVEETIADSFNKKNKRKTLFFIIEIIQNIEKYSEHLDSKTDSCLISYYNSTLNIESKNIIENKKIDKLKNKLNSIISTSDKEVKELYFETLSASLENGKISPGLGFIELKRKNNNPFEFNFTKVNDQYSTFQLNISIDIEDDKNEMIKSEDFSIIKDLLNEKKQIALFAGSFNGATASSFVNLINKLDLSQNKVLNSKYQHAIIEMVQNAKRHGVAVDNRKNGFFYIEEKDNKIETVCCNQTNNTTSLIKSIDELNKCSLEELKIKSRESLLNFEVSGGLGLIQLAMFSHPSPLFSKIISTSKNINFLYIGVLFQTSEQ